MKITLYLLATFFLSFISDNNTEAFDNFFGKTQNGTLNSVKVEGADFLSANKIFKGIYVASDWNKPIEDYVLKSTVVDGVFLRLYWDRLQPSVESYDWSFLDSELTRISESGKKISLGVAAGSHCPGWIYNAGVPGLDFTEFRHRGKGKLFSVKVPVPWNEKYLQLWTGFIQNLATHLKLNNEIYKNITLVKLTGINESTVEIRLPAQKDISNVKGSSTDAPAIWRGAGYKPSLVRQAWKQILNCYYENFPGKCVSMAVIPKKGFPAINDSGNEMKKNAEYDFTEELIADGSEKFKERFVVQWNSLKEDANIPALMTFVNKFGAAKGYQLTESELADPECLKNNTTCNEDAFKSVLDKGINEGAFFIEIFQKDILAFPKSILNAHLKLIQ